MGVWVGGWVMGGWVGGRATGRQACIVCAGAILKEYVFEKGSG